MSRMKRGVAVSLAASAMLSATAAHAQSEVTTHQQRHFSWLRSDAASSCPDAQQVQRDVESRLGWSPFLADDRRREAIEAVVTREGATWRATIELRNAEGQSLGSRQVTSAAPTCDSLAATAALAIALIIQPVPPAVPASPVPLPACSASPAPCPSPRAALPAAPLPRTAPSEGSAAQPLHGEAIVAAVAAVNVLPRPAAGSSLRVEAQLYRRLFVQASASFFAEQHARANGADVAFGMTWGSLGACYRLPVAGGLHIAGCASTVLGSLGVTVHSPVPVAPGPRTWWAGTVGAQSSWELGHFAVSLQLAALDHFARHTYLIAPAPSTGSGPIFVEPSIAAVASLGAGVSF